MVNQMYPKLEINLKYLRENVAEMVRRCGERGIEIAGVIKGTTGLAAYKRKDKKRNCLS